LLAIQIYIDEISKVANFLGKSKLIATRNLI